MLNIFCDQPALCPKELTSCEGDCVVGAAILSCVMHYCGSSARRM